MTGKVSYLQKGQDGQILCTFSVHNVEMEGVHMTQMVHALSTSESDSEEFEECCLCCLCFLRYLSLRIGHSDCGLELEDIARVRQR